MCVSSPKAGSAQSLYCSGVQTVEVPVDNDMKHNYAYKNKAFIRTNVYATFCSLVRPVLNSYQACEPSCSCSSPAGTGFHSQCGTRWCCMWRSIQSLWEWTCSLPKAVGGTEAERANSTCFAWDYKHTGLQQMTQCKLGAAEVQKRITTSWQNQTQMFQTQTNTKQNTKAF